MGEKNRGKNWKNIIYLVKLTRILENHCEDCYDKKELRTYTAGFLPDGASAELCEECAERRKTRVTTGLPPDPIGLPALGTWRDVGPLTVLFQDIPPVIVSIKRLCDGENKGLVRLRFGNEGPWLAGGAFGDSNVGAIWEVKSFLRIYYFPGQPFSIEGESATPVPTRRPCYL